MEISEWDLGVKNINLIRSTYLLIDGPQGGGEFNSVKGRVSEQIR